MKGGARLDYAAEGRALLERVNLNLPGAPQKYDNANAVYRHPNGATLFVGNVVIASSRNELESLGISRIVFCQDGDDGEGSMTFASDPALKYLHYPIGRWRDGKRRGKLEDGEAGWRDSVFYGDVLSTPANTGAYFQRLFDFVQEELECKQNVLIHCLAGAHRAGTAGIACLMYFGNLDAKTATLTAQVARPVVDPIGDFPLLLESLDRFLASERT